MHAHLINAPQCGSATALPSPVRESDYEEESSKLSASLARLNEEIQQMEGSLAPALKPMNCPGDVGGKTSVKPVVAPLIDTLETYALLVNSMAFQVSALRARLCF